jgi:hypothetical protein
MAEGRVEPARLTRGAMVRPDGMVVYPRAAVDRSSQPLRVDFARETIVKSLI